MIIVRKELLLELILALQNQPAVRILTSRIGDGTLLSDLRILSSRIVLNQYNIASAIPLVKHIVGNEADGQICNDSEIWDAVFDLVTNELLARTNTPPPPAVLDEAILNTPFRSSSATLSGIEQTHAEVDQRICEELKGQVFVNVGGFFERYFEEKTWSENAGAIYKLSRSEHKESRWSHWPQRSHQDSFLELFMRFQDIALQGRSRKYYTSANKALRGSEADRKLDIFLAPADATSEDGKHDWSNVLVIGEHKRNPDEDCSKAILVQLAGYAREVFGSQPGRRFVHGFTICGSVMRLWVFDRSGAYSSEKFDAHRNPEHFVQVIAGYALMSDSELGLNTFIHRDGNFKYVVAEGQKIYLQAYKSARELLEAFRDAIAGHKSLLEDGNILHWDVSENNIIITESVIDGDPKGRLIDLDLAKELDSVPSGASHRTGTMQFMAIEVLQGNGHTYRHDLESFFYLFIWMCIRYGHDNLGGREEAAASHSRPIIRRVRPGNTSILQGWYTGTYAQIANIKRGHMVGFTEITAEFAPEFINLKDLAHELRDVLFPFHGKLFFAGTYKDRNIMYGGMIDAFDKAISRLGKEPQVTT